MLLEVAVVEFGGFSFVISREAYRWSRMQLEAGWCRATCAFSNSVCGVASGEQTSRAGHRASGWAGRASCAWRADPSHGSAHKGPPPPLAR